MSCYKTFIDCVIPLDQTHRIYPPFLLSPETYEVLQVPPENENLQFILPIKQTVIITCPGGYLLHSPIDGATSIAATCNSESQLEAAGHIIDFADLDCSLPQFEYETHDYFCWDNSTFFEVGFYLGSDFETFIPQYRLCFNNLKKIPLYTNYNITKSIGLTSWERSRSNINDYFVYSFTMDVKDMYDKDYQIATLNTYLGLPQDSDKYFNNVTCAQTCLYSAAMFRPLNFYYANQQLSIFRYINTAPMWFSIYGSHWLDLEKSIRLYASDNKVELEVTSGTYGVATLPHDFTGQDMELNLYHYNNEKSLSVPKYFWKLVYYREAKKAVVILLSNDPFSNDDPLCSDIQDTISWLNWRDPYDITKGYGVACTYEDVKAKIIPYIPSLEVESVLT